MAQSLEEASPPVTGWRRYILVEPPRPAAIRNRPNAYWLVVGTVCIGAFMGQLDASIVTVAFPTMQRSFHTTLGSVEWVALAYLVTLVAAVTAVGRFADMVGRKLLYTYGFAVFTLASALCGLAPNLISLDVFRIVQAFGAAMLQANSVALITVAVPRDKLGRAIGIQGAAQALGLSLGPTVGGLLLSLASWRLIFYVNVPAGALGLVLGWFLLPRSRHLTARTKFDWWGLSAFVPGIAALLLAISLGRDAGFASPQIVLLFAAAVIGLVAFVIRERRALAPMVELSLFRDVTFTAGIASGFLSYSVLFGVLLVVPYLFERAMGLSTGTAGLALTALPAALGVTAPFAGRLADRLGPRALTVTGMLLTAAGLTGAALAHSSVGVVVGMLAVIGVGLGAFTPPNNAAIMGSAPREHSGLAGGLLNMTRGIGTAMGVALTGLVFAVVAGSRGSGIGSLGPTGRGFAAACWLLVGLALAAAALAALRGDAQLVHDPLATAE